MVYAACIPQRRRLPAPNPRVLMRLNAGMYATCCFVIAVAVKLSCRLRCEHPAPADAEVHLRVLGVTKDVQRRCRNLQ